MSYAANANSSTPCDDLYFRQTVKLNPIPPPPATNITLSKHFLVGATLTDAVTFPGYVQNQSPADRVVTIVVQTCNSGAGYEGPVTILDSGNVNGNPFFGSEQFRSSIPGKN